MDIEELKQFIESSDFTHETKQKIAGMLAGKAVLDYDVYNAVKEILQQELDSDFKEVGVDLPEGEGGDDASKYEAGLVQVDQKIEEVNKEMEANASASSSV